jgi:Holliday junction resolvasome RuvABC endonuclease subunit
MKLKLKQIDIDFASWNARKVKQMIDGKQGVGSREEVLLMLRRQIAAEIENNLPELIDEITD